MSRWVAVRSIGYKLIVLGAVDLASKEGKAVQSDPTSTEHSFTADHSSLLQYYARFSTFRPKQPLHA